MMGRMLRVLELTLEGLEAIDQWERGRVSVQIEAQRRELARLRRALRVELRKRAKARGQARLWRETLWRVARMHGVEARTPEVIEEKIRRCLWALKRGDDGEQS